MIKNFVVYLTRYSGDKLPKYYIGSTTKEKAESGKYFGSVRSKKYKKIFELELKNNIHLFSIKILSFHKTRKEALDEELRIQQLRNVVKSQEYFNQSYACVNGYFGSNNSGSDSSRYGKSNYNIWVKKYGVEIANIKDNAYRAKQSIVNGGINNPMFNRKNEVIAIDDVGNKLRVSKNEFEINDRLSGHTIGYTYVNDKKTNELIKIKKDEYKKNKDKYVHHNLGIKHTIETRNKLSIQRKNMLCAKDWDGNYYRVNKNDIRFQTGEIGSASAVRWLITDTDGIEYKVMNIKKFFKNRGMFFSNTVEYVDGEKITKHKTTKHISLNGWILKRIDKIKKYDKRN